MGGDMSLLDTPLGAWLVLIGLFVFGSFFGSFANVVIYRLPLGQSLLWPGSHCPKCNHPIRWYDNVPVFGWLTLNGRCRDCAATISARYPLVEALFGFLLAALGWLEIADARSNLPDPAFAGVATRVPHVGILVGYHMLLLGTLVVAALIDYDRQRIPRRLLVFGLLCGLALPLVWSALRPVPLTLELLAILRNQPPLRALVEGLAGIAAGALLGCLAWPAIAQVSGRRWPSAVVLELATIGAMLGWQAVCGIAVLAAIGDLLAALVSFAWSGAGRPGWPAWLAIVTAVWLGCWSTFVRMVPALGRGELQLAVAAGAIVAIAAMIDWLIRRALSDRPARG